MYASRRCERVSWQEHKAKHGGYGRCRAIAGEERRQMALACAAEQMRTNPNPSRRAGLPSTDGATAHKYARTGGHEPSSETVVSFLPLIVRMRRTHSQRESKEVRAASTLRMHTVSSVAPGWGLRRHGVARETRRTGRAVNPQSSDDGRQLLRRPYMAASHHIVTAGHIPAPQACHISSFSLRGLF